MTENFKSSPIFALKDIGVFKTAKIKLEGNKAIKIGEGQYGNWYLWAGEVENQKVWEGRDKDKKAIEGYTGRVVFFPTERVNEELEKFANGNIGTEISITKEVEEGQYGVIRKYIVKKITNGNPATSSLTPGEIKLVGDIGDLMEDGYEVTEDQVVSASQEEKYGKEISEERAKTLFKLIRKI